MFGAFLSNHPLTQVLVPATLGIANVISTTIDSPDDLTPSHELMTGPEGPGFSAYESADAESEVALSSVPVVSPGYPLFLNIRYRVGI